MDIIEDIQRRAGITAMKESIMDKLGDCTIHYLVAMLWLMTDEEGNEMDHLHIDDIDIDSIRDAANDCRAFMKKAEPLLRQAADRGYTSPDGNGFEAMVGHDFFLTRHGHGAGFWDRRELQDGDLGEKLSDIAKSFGETWAYVGDDGKVYIQ